MDLSPGVKRPGGDAYHAPPTTAEVEKTWIYTCLPNSSIINTSFVGFEILTGVVKKSTKSEI
jgi:hypothetical protein